MELKFTNASGGVLPLTNSQYFYLTNVDGQTTANADISATVIGGIDGDTVNNVQAQPRTITLDLKIKNGVDVETAKRAVLNIVKLKRNGTLTWTQNARTVNITGVVESVDMPRWENGVMMQIALHCEQPFWEDIDNVVEEISEALNMHYFVDDQNDMLYFPESGIPLGEYNITRLRTFNNNGDVAVGMTIEVIAYETCTNPIIYASDGRFFGVGYGTGDKKVVLNAGDVVVISTHKGAKSVKLNGVSLFNKIKPKSTWLQLEAGENTFAVNSDDVSTNNVTFNMVYKQRYI